MDLTKRQLKQLIKEELQEQQVQANNINVAAKHVIKGISNLPGAQNAITAKKLKIDIGDSRKYPGRKYLTLLGVEPRQENANLYSSVSRWLDQHARDLITNKGGFIISMRNAGWLTPPADWGLVGWKVFWSGHIKPYKR